ncbi:alpha/beta fold hydrolase [Nonomuraea sp. AD125B]|uniref:alpha/beta fold hydrolase n=1 Tax=Nonomuraea sp. AD125B TaxID=3242897 RepID=UPI003528B526
MITLDRVTSQDGTEIAYRRLGGDGPGLVLLHGAMQTGQGNIELAEALSGAFTCYVPDRRGRGRSGPAGPRYGLAREVEDLSALLAATGAEHVMGVSSGAIVALRTALARPELRTVIAFEPPLDLDGSNPTGWLERFDRELAAGRVPAALVTGMLGTRMGPAFLGLLPRPLLEAMTTAMLKRQDRTAADGEPTFRELAPTLRQDVQVVAETADDLDAYRRVRAEVLLLGGTRSPAYLRNVLTALRGVLPRCQRVDLPGLDHSATSNAAMRGRPEQVAAEVRRFLRPAG